MSNKVEKLMKQYQELINTYGLNSPQANKHLFDNQQNKEFLGEAQKIHESH